MFVVLLSSMRKGHVFEYERHERNMKIIFMATTISFVLVFLFEMSIFVLYTCTLGDLGETVQLAFFNPMADEPGIC